MNKILYLSSPPNQASVQFENAVGNTLTGYVRGSVRDTSYEEIVLFNAKSVKPSNDFIAWLKEVQKITNSTKEEFMKKLVELFGNKTLEK